MTAGIAYPADYSGTYSGPIYTANQGRTALAAAMAGATATRPLGGISGVRPGTPATTVTATSTTWTAAAFAGYIDTAASATNGGYYFSFPSGGTGSVTAAAASARIDIIYVQLSDVNTGDGTTVAPKVDVLYLAGTAGSGVPPTTPARSFVIALINVPATGGGSPTVTWVAPTCFAAGGTPTVGSVAQRAATFPSPSGNELVYRTDKLYFERYSAAASLWQPITGDRMVTQTGAASPLNGSATDVTGTGLSFTVDTGTQVRALFEYGGKLSLSTTSTATLGLVIDGVTVRTIQLATGAGALSQASEIDKYLVTLAAGAHSIKLQASANAGTASLSQGFLYLRLLDLDPNL